MKGHHPLKTLILHTLDTLLTPKSLKSTSTAGAPCGRLVPAHRIGRTGLRMRRAKRGYINICIPFRCRMQRGCSASNRPQKAPCPQAASQHRSPGFPRVNRFQDALLIQPFETSVEHADLWRLRLAPMGLVRHRCARTCVGDTMSRSRELLGFLTASRLCG